MSPLTVPLFPGVPGGPELLVILLVMFLLLGVPLALIVLGFAGRVSGDGDDERVSELEERVEQLEATRERHGDGADGTSSESGPAHGTSSESGPTDGTPGNTGDGRS